jgi:hypothetical protein
MATGAIVARILTQYSDKGSKQAQKDIKKLGADFDKFAKQSFRAFGLATAAFAGFATKIGIDSIKAASDIQQQFGALDAVFGKNSKNLQDFSRSMVEYGLSTADAARYAALLGTQLKGLGLSEEDAIDRTKTLQVLAADLAATYGGTTADAVQALSSTFKGEYNPIERYGVAIKKSDINARVAAKGLGKLEGDLLKAAEAQTAFEMIIAKTTAAQGQAIREYDTVAAQLQRLDASYMNIKASLGLALLPVVQEFAGYLLSDVLPRIQEWVDLNKDELSEGLRSATVFLRRLLEGALAFGQWVTDNTGKIKLLAGIIAGMFVANKVAAFIVSLNTIVATLAVLRTTAIGTGIALAFATAGSSALTAATALAAVGITALVTKRYMDFNAKSTDKVTKSTKGLTGSTKANIGVTNSATTAINKYNSSTSNLTEKQKKALEEEKKLVAIRKQLKEQFGITTKEDDPIQLEAARLNLIKQQALGIEALTQNQYAFIEAQFASNVQAQRYADILAVINDNKISSTELDALAYKWGKSREFVLKYIQEVTGINNIVIGKDLGLDAANSWENAKKKLDEYLKSLQATGQVSPQTRETISQIDQATADALAASDAALAAAERARKANEKFADAGIFPGAFPRSNPGDFRRAEEASNATGPIISTPTMGAVVGFTPTSQYGAIPTSGAIAGPMINVTVNAGNVIGSSAALVDTVRQGILAGQSSGNIISYNPLDI